MDDFFLSYGKLSPKVPDWIKGFKSFVINKPKSILYKIQAKLRGYKNKEGLRIRKLKLALVVFISLVLVVALAYLIGIYLDGGSEKNASKVSEKAAENKNTVLEAVILNGDFEKGSLGWRNPEAIQKEDNGNHYIINNCSWEVCQEMNLLPHTTYAVSANTKKGTAQGPARIAFSFLDINGVKLPQFYDIKYTHTGGGWEKIPRQFIMVPKNAATAWIYLLSEDPKGYHCFDNITVTRTSEIGDRKATEMNADQNELMINGDFEMGLYGWIGMADRIKYENGNRFLRNGYNWEIFQIIDVNPGQKYLITAETRKGTSSKPARIKVVFLNQDEKRVPEFFNILHSFDTTGWENVTEVIQAPSSVNQLRVYLLADDPEGNGTYCDFDSISLKAVTDEELKKKLIKNSDLTRMINGSQKSGQYVVKEGDTVSGLARQFNIPEQELISANAFSDPGRLEIGQIIYLPQGNTQSLNQTVAP